MRQALRAWNAKLDATLKKMGFQQSAHEAAMYRRGSGRGGSGRIVLLIVSTPTI